MRTVNRRILSGVCGLVVLVIVAVKPSAAEDWPCFRGPTRQGISHETGVPAEWSAASNVAWKAPIPGEGWSSPIVFADRVFVTAATDGGASLRLLCLDRLTGTVHWNKEVLRQNPGHKSDQNSYASSTPATDGRYVYIVAFDGSLAAVSTNGDVVWTNRDFKFYGEHGLAVSPLLYNSLLIVPFDGSSSGPDKTVGWQKPWDRAVIMALDTDTGKIRWTGQRGTSRIAHVSPQIVSENGADQLASSAGDVVQGFDLRSGQRLWTASSTGEGVVPSLVIGDGLIFATSGFGDPAIRAVRTGGKGDVSKTHIAWESRDDVPMVPSMLYIKPYLFAVTEAGVATCRKAATGEVLWRSRLGDRYSASPIWVEGRVYFLSEKGRTTVIEAGPEFKVVSQHQINEKCCASPAVSQEHIFIRSQSSLYCIGRGK